MAKDSPAPQPKGIKITTSLEMLRGVYANTIKVSVNDNETIIDFAFVNSDETGTQGQLVSRVIIPQGFTKTLADSISKTLEAHLQKKHSP